MRMTPTIFIVTTGPWSWSSGSVLRAFVGRREVGRRVAVVRQRRSDRGAELDRRLVDDHLVVAGGVGQPAGEHLGPLDRVPPAVAHRGERPCVRAQLAEPPGSEREAAPRRHLGDRAQLGHVGVTDADLAGEEHGVGRLQLLAHPGVGRGRALGAGDGRRDQPDRQPRHARRAGATTPSAAAPHSGTRPAGRARTSPDPRAHRTSGARRRAAGQPVSGRGCCPHLPRRPPTTAPPPRCRRGQEPGSRDRARRDLGCLLANQAGGITPARRAAHDSTGGLPRPPSRPVTSLGPVCWPDQRRNSFRPQSRPQPKSTSR